MVAPAFGFSVGDFIAGIQVAKKAFDALDDTRGATPEYQAAALELDKLDALLRRVQAFDGQDVDADILHLLTILAKTCQIPVLRFSKKIEPLKKHLDAAIARKGSLGGIAKSAAAKVKWALVVKEALAELKASIAPCLIDIDILLQLIAIDQNSKHGKNTREIIEKLEALLSHLQNTHQIIISSMARRSDVQDLAQLIRQLESRLQYQLNQPISRAIQGLSSAQTALHPGVVSPNSSVQGQLSTLQDTVAAMTLRLERVELNTTVHDTQGSSEEIQSRDSSERQKQSLALVTRGKVVDGVRQMLALLLAVLPTLGTFSKMLRSPLAKPREFVEAPIRLHDFDEFLVFDLPWEHFRFWPVVEEYLLNKMGFESCAFRPRVALYHERGTVTAASKWEVMGKPGTLLGWLFYGPCIHFDPELDEFVIGQQVAVYCGRKQTWTVYLTNERQRPAVKFLYGVLPAQIKTSLRGNWCSQEALQIFFEADLERWTETPQCTNHRWWCKCRPCAIGVSLPCQCRACCWLREHKASIFAGRIPPWPKRVCEHIKKNRNVFER